MTEIRPNYWWWGIVSTHINEGNAPAASQRCILQSNTRMVETWFRHTFSCFWWKCSGNALDTVAVPFIQGRRWSLLRPASESNVLKEHCFSLNLADRLRRRHWKRTTNLVKRITSQNFANRIDMTYSWRPNINAIVNETLDRRADRAVR